MALPGVAGVTGGVREGHMLGEGLLLLFSICPKSMKTSKNSYRLECCCNTLREGTPTGSGGGGGGCANLLMLANAMACVLGEQEGGGRTG
mgnify:CR=1 FL=1